MDKNDNSYNGSKRKATNAKKRNRRKNCTKRNNGEEGSDDESEGDMIPNVDDMQLKIHDEKWGGRGKKKK